MIYDCLSTVEIWSAPAERSGDGALDLTLNMRMTIA